MQPPSPSECRPQFTGTAGRQYAFDDHQHGLRPLRGLPRRAIGTFLSTSSPADHLVSMSGRRDAFTCPVPHERAACRG